MQSFTQKTIAALGSRRCFNIVLGAFVAQALWFVCSAIYPMPFDEDFHFGIIKIYSHHWLPFLSSQPPDAGAFGAVARDPSYLYHYLMSFPYRLIELVIHGETGQVIALRLINVAFFALSLVLFRRVLQRVGTSGALINVSMAIFTLIPIVPQLAAHINYDNLLMVLVAWALLLTFRAVDALRERRVDMQALMTLAIVCTLASLVKYAFLPMFVVIIAYVLLVAWRSFRGKFQLLWPSMRAGFLGLTRKSKIILSVLLVISIGLFAQRDLVNVLKYKSPVPDCNDVLTVQECSHYGPWVRNYTESLTVSTHHFNKSPVHYTSSWLAGMWHRLFFAINGAKSYYNNYLQLPLPSGAAIVLALAGLVVALVWGRRIFAGHSNLVFLLAVALAYCAALWLDDYQQYLDTGNAVAINGRYLLPVLFLAAAIMGRGFSIMFAKHSGQKLAAALVVLAFFLQGGGVLTFMSRSDAAWYWPNPTVVRVNNAAHHLVTPILIEGPKQRPH